MIKSDRWIRRMALEHDMINPYSEKQVNAGVISYGVSSYGYDLRVADEFKIFTNVNSTIVDPKKFDERSFVTVNADVAKAKIIGKNDEDIGLTGSPFRWLRGVHCQQRCE